MTAVALKHGASEALSLAAIRTDGGTQPRAALYQNVIDDYADALADGANFPPVVVFYDGTDYWLADGFHRHGAHKKLGLVEIDADIRQGARRDAVLYSVGANGSHGLRRTNEDKRRAVLTLLQDAEWAAWSDREIARRAGVSNKFVSLMRGELSTVNNTQYESRTFIHPKTGQTTTMSVANIGKPAQASAPVVRASSEPAFIADDDTTPEYLQEVPVAANDNEAHNHRAQGTGENEWYTPASYIELARGVMGGFDVDPASNPIAQKTVQAGTFYTEETNGLDKEWSGRVWLNPPYAQPAISHFAEKTVEEFQSGRCTEAIVLTHNYTDTGWFHRLARAATAICWTKGRIRFESPTGEKASPTQGQTFFYFGPKPEAFVDAFDEVVGFARRVN